MKSWRTTVCGVLNFVGVLAVQLNAFFDNNDATVPNWELVAGAGILLIGLFFARDNKVSSEAAGAK